MLLILWSNSDIYPQPPPPIPCPSWKPAARKHINRRHAAPSRDDSSAGRRDPRG